MLKLLIFLIAGLIIIAPSSIDKGPTEQTRAEQLISNFLAGKGSYMALYFSNIDTAFDSFEEEPATRELTSKVTAYQDSTIMFSRIDVAKADSYYSLYKKFNLRKDSLRIHFEPRPIGFLILHHFQFEGKLWTDSFMIDFNIQHILKIKETIE